MNLFKELDFSIIGFFIGFLIIVTVLYAVYVNRKKKSTTFSSNAHSLIEDKPTRFPVNYSNEKMDEPNEELNNQTIDYHNVESKIRETAEQDSAYSQTNIEMIGLFEKVEILQNTVNKLSTNNENRFYEELSNYTSILNKVSSSISSMETEFTDFKNNHHMLSRIEKNGEQIIRKYDKLKNKIGIIERDVSKNTSSIHGLNYSYGALLATTSAAIRNGCCAAAETRPPVTPATTPPPAVAVFQPAVAVFQPAATVPPPPPPSVSPLPSSSSSSSSSSSPADVECRMTTRFTQNMYDRIPITEELVKDAKSKLKSTTAERRHAAVGANSPPAALPRTFSDGDTICTLTPRTQCKPTA